MKFQNKETALSKFKLAYLYLTATIILFSSFSPIKVSAGDSTSDPLNLAQIKLLKVIDNDQVLFEVAIDNKNQEIFRLIVTDQDGYVFYDSKCQDLMISKRFLFNNLENQNTKLVFTVKNAEVSQTQSFQVNTELVKNTVVTKL